MTAGECYRLITKEDFENLYPSATPEINRSNLAPIILQMKVLITIRVFSNFSGPGSWESNEF